jgi:IclR family pca regulon transcriptional regulator
MNRRGMNGAAMSAVSDRLEDDPSFVAAFARGLSVIRAFDIGRESMTLAEVAKLTDLPRATVRRSLYTLQALGFVASDGKQFRLTPKILSLGYAYLASTPLPRVIQPALEHVSETTHESCSASILDGTEIVYIARAATKRIMSVGLAVGSRLPAHVTSMGRVLLASEPPERQKALLAASDLKALTPRTETRPERLLAILEGVRADGYALVDQELEIGLCSLGVPIRNATGHVVAAMNVSVQSGRVSTEAMLGTVLPVLQDAAEGVRLSLP